MQKFVGTMQMPVLLRSIVRITMVLAIAAGASSVDFQPGQSTANAVVVPIGADGRVSLFNGEGTTHAIADLVGWYH